MRPTGAVVGMAAVEAPDIRTAHGANRERAGGAPLPFSAAARLSSVFFGLALQNRVPMVMGCGQVLLLPRLRKNRCDNSRLWGDEVKQYKNENVTTEVWEKYKFQRQFKFVKGSPR
jgi:hypothetical protein